MAFHLHIYESELKEIEEFVSKFQNIETGGDLFGLWKANGDPVVQLTIGPGNGCRRTSVSFHQDTNYLMRVGTNVNNLFMLVHIGSWHSHHQLNLIQPSAGDQRTVRDNFPEGLKRYVMVIANITRGSVIIHPYLFTSGGYVCKAGIVNIVALDSPFREVGYIISVLRNGAERHCSSETVYSARTCNQLFTSSKQCNKYTSHFPTKTETCQSNPFHYHDQLKSSSPIDEDYGSHGDYSTMDVEPPEYYGYTEEPSKKELCDITPNHHDTSGMKQWYETEQGGGILKDIHQKLNSITSKIDYQRDKESKDLTMSFTLDGHKRTIKFPSSFDRQQALIECSRHGKCIKSTNIISDIRKVCNSCETVDCQQSPNKQGSFPSRKEYDLLHPKNNTCSNAPHPHSRQVDPRTNALRTYLPRHASPSKPRNQPATVRKSHYPFDTWGSPQRWYTSNNTKNGKSEVEQIKTDIEGYLKTTNNSGKKVKSQHSSKQLTFYHNFQDWIIEFVDDSGMKNIQLKRNGEKKPVSVFNVPPHDVVGELSRHCSCEFCRVIERSRSGACEPRQTFASTRPNLHCGEKANTNSHTASPNSMYCFHKYRR